MTQMSATSSLTPEKALIFRITHRDNLPWILEHGLHCRTLAKRGHEFEVKVYPGWFF